MKNIALLIAFTLMVFAVARADSKYPSHWWKAVDRTTAPSWEILPQDAAEGEVILSKRNELGLLSNFSHTPFKFRGKFYESVEGLWQSMKYPENKQDPRAIFPGITWDHKRTDVAQMIGSKAKKAGSAASKNMKTMDINWVSFEGRKMTYKTAEKGHHYHLIKDIMWEKLTQNPEVKKVLLQTGDLVLKPDHKQGDNPPPAWKYHEIWMEFRAKLQNPKN